MVPETVPAQSISSFSDEVDVIVVGLGMAGGCAAVEAAASGARVLVLERAAVAGGTTAMAGGHFYLGGGTEVQQATGQHDSAAEMAAYLTAVSKEPVPELIDAYCEGSAEHFRWLEALGFEFERSYYPHKAVIQPETQGLMYTGNEQVWPFREQAAPAPRGHKVPVPGDTGGAGMVVKLLVERLGELGAEIRYETGVSALVVDDDRVVGATWKHFGETGAVRAKSVVLATGGFVMNREMLAQHVPRLADERVFALGSTYDDGIGIRLGQSVGAATKNLDQAFVTAPVYPPATLLTGLIVNRNGDRFVAEDSYHARTSAFALEQPDSVAYLVVDSRHVEMPTMPLVQLIDGWEEVAEMEAALGIPAGRLQSALDRYNANAVRGEDPDFHKAATYLEPQDTGPWAAFDLSLGKAFYSGFTLGGLAISADGEVLRGDGSTVAGLYAAGACASTIAQDAKGYSSGTQLGAGSFFGRRAGRAAADATTQGAQDD
ncbi:FAD-binding protein [Mycolicibacterium mucogenicum]|uniref:FAD-binding protein n=1 Tax=Mycolicibacterium mucogenicum TaxID=56689 RepID=UPI00226A5B87|nr:FAD-binding protein [Mycolicibacterium mucogenicum]MCX8560573.1 FAD-binding protein [Mycolicibacterium mucogenicum]